MGISKKKDIFSNIQGLKVQIAFIIFFKCWQEQLFSDHILYLKHMICNQERFTLNQR